MDLDVTVRVVEAVTVAAVAGDIDLHTSPPLREGLVHAVTSRDGTGPDLVIDLSAVDFIDSTGLGVLVGIRRRVATNSGLVHLVCPQGTVVRLLSVTALDRVFEVHSALPDAIAAVRKSQPPPTA
jgi:anti-sigma B factor antagonist